MGYAPGFIPFLYFCEEMENNLRNKIFNQSKENFEDVALEVFRFQSFSNPVYNQYIRLLGVNPKDVKCIGSIPYLPISMFKFHRVLVDGFEPEIVFTSSGTTGSETSRHYVASTLIYQESFIKSFNIFYGDPSQYRILALLPSYLERQGSSLVYMVKHLIDSTVCHQSGFYINNYDELAKVLIDQPDQCKQTLLIGVTFALLELAKKDRFRLTNTIVMETGGMKGRGNELVRSELHKILADAFGVDRIHSEYGMTELLSQAYSKGDGIFSCPPWMKVLIRDPYDPFELMPNERSGAVNVIDLANLYSCSFIQTDDLGVLHNDGSFEILGRMDGTQIRGCNLLVTT